MATNKQRIQAYIDQQLFETFEAERAKWDISQSQALERILAERYNTKVPDSSIGYSIACSDLTRLESEIRGMVALNHKRFEQVFSQLDELEGAVSQLFRELPATNSSESNSESDSELPILKYLSESNSELPSESLVLADSNSDGELPSESLVLADSNSDGELPSESLVLADSNSDGELPSESLSENSPLTINSTHPYFERLILCIERDEYLSYWTDSDSFSPDIRQAKLYDKQTYLLKQIEKLVERRDYDRNWLKFTTARNCIKKDCDRYSLQEIFDSWKKLEDRKEKRKSIRRKAAIASQ